MQVKRPKIRAVLGRQGRLHVTMLLALALIVAAPLPLVVVDAGHGGLQDGAVGICGIKEKDVTLGIASEMQRILTKSGKVRIALTRTDDVTLDLKERARIVNAMNADMFVSVHANSGGSPKSRGVETYFLSRGSSDKRIAKLVARENDTVSGVTVKADDETAHVLHTLALSASHVESARFAERLNETLTRELAVHSRGVLQAPFFVLLAAHMPSALVEVGFLTNKAECEQLADAKHRERLAQILSSAILLHVAREEFASARP